MKTGKSLVELAQALTHVKDQAKDYVVPTSKLTADVVTVTGADNLPETGYTKCERKEVRLAFANGIRHQLALTPWSRTQLAQYTDIPKAYFDRIMTENPELAADSINHGLAKAASTGSKESRMVRTVDGTVRGLLSSKYRILDSYDMLETILPVAQEKGLQVISSEVTDRRLFIKMLSPVLKADIKVGDTVQYGLMVSTSDVGAGSVRVEPFNYRLLCENGMISNTSLRKFHVGKSQGDGDVFEILSDRTKEVSDAAFWMQVRDIVLASLDPKNFEQQVDRIRVAAGLPIKNFDLPEVVELTMRATGMTGENKKNSILAALASGNEGAGLTQWGLINSITRAAQAPEFDYETSIEMERAAGSILELPRKDWARIAEQVGAA
jgi:hypothetical protein